MRKHLSLFSCILICVIYLFVRLNYSDLGKRPHLKVTDWDALGYYMYLPAIVIYHDVKLLNWFPEIDQQYNVSGGELYQALKQDNGNYYFKYLGGVAVLQSPFFLAAHLYAKNSSHYKADGFSPPYQYAIAFGNLFYFILALFLLRSFLSIYFQDRIVAITLCLVTLATNLIQYVAVDGGMSHGYIFPLYVAILWLTYKWHKKPTLYSAAGIGYVIGLATISRPTEAVMLFIPLLWSTDSRDHSGEKWRLVKEHKSHLAIAALFGLFGILPQLLYWKVATGSFVFDVGSKWTFLNPFFRVLFGWEKGWFIYTPVTLFFVVGLFFVKRYPFKNSVIWFCILNIYIIISWFDWRYGGSYSTRALSQSYAVFALPFAAFISYIEGKRWKILVYIIGVYLIAVNLFQIWQYNSGILHFNDMNRKYYGRIYLNRNPLASDMSLLDTDEFVRDENKYRKQLIITRDSSIPIILQDGKHFIFLDTSLAISKPAWIKVQASVSVTGGIWKGRLFAETGKKKVSVRMDNAISAAGKINEYVFYIRLDEETDPVLHLRMWLEAGGEMDCIIKGFQIFALHKR